MKGPALASEHILFFFFFLLFPGRIHSKRLPLGLSYSTTRIIFSAFPLLPGVLGQAFLPCPELVTSVSRVCHEGALLRLLKLA